MALCNEKSAWHPTNQLRFVEKNVFVEHDINGHHLRDGYVRGIRVRILEQLWQNLSDGSVEWREVPLVVEGQSSEG